LILSLSTGVFLLTQTAQLGRRAGIPDGVINIITTQKNINDVAKEMCENPSVKKVTFTGSTAVAKLLYKMAASTIKKCALLWSILYFKLFIKTLCRISIEAGGNAPFIVFDDADIDQAVEGGLALIHNPRTCAYLIWMYQVLFSASSAALDKLVFARTASTSNPTYTRSLHLVSRSELPHLKLEMASKAGCERVF
jgi:hypothetical protein